MRKVCKHCGKELTGKRTSYCNDGCKKGYENGKNYQRKCRHCGEYFIGSRTGYTCPKCLSTIRKNKHKYKSKCIVCGKNLLEVNQRNTVLEVVKIKMLVSISVNIVVRNLRVGIMINIAQINV